MSKFVKQKCIHCLRFCEYLTEDHILPESWYPNNTPANIEKWVAPACNKCNSELGKIEEERVKQQALKELNETLEQKVHVRTVELETVNRELESFNYSVAHDLRAPLRVIQGFGKMILKTANDRLKADEQDNLRDMIKNARHMGNLVDDLLDFSRLGKTEIARSPVNMEEMVNRMSSKSGRGLKITAKLKGSPYH